MLVAVTVSADTTVVPLWKHRTLIPLGTTWDSHSVVSNSSSVKAGRHGRVVNFEKARLYCNGLVWNQLAARLSDDDLDRSIAGVAQLHCTTSTTIVHTKCTGCLAFVHS